MTRLLIVKVFRANCFQICLLALNLGLAALLIKFGTYMSSNIVLLFAAGCIRSICCWLVCVQLYQHRTQSWLLSDSGSGSEEYYSCSKFSGLSHTFAGLLKCECVKVVVCVALLMYWMRLSNR